MNESQNTVDAKAYRQEVERITAERDAANSRTLRMWERAKAAEAALARVKALADSQHQLLDDGPLSLITWRYCSCGARETRVMSDGCRSLAPAEYPCAALREFRAALAEPTPATAPHAGDDAWCGPGGMTVARCQAIDICDCFAPREGQGRLVDEEHHPKCYQTRGIPQSLLDLGVLPTLCDCAILRMFDADRPAPVADPRIADGPHAQECGTYCKGRTHSSGCHRKCPTCGGTGAPMADPSEEAGVAYPEPSPEMIQQLVDAAPDLNPTALALLVKVVRQLERALCSESEDELRGWLRTMYRTAVQNDDAIDQETGLPAAPREYAEPTPPVAPHAEDGALCNCGYGGFHEELNWRCDKAVEDGTARPAPVADPSEEESP